MRNQPETGIPQEKRLRSQPASAPAAKADAVKPEVPPAMAAPPPATIFDEMDLWIDNTKAPLPWLKWGADLRYRDEYLNAAGLNSHSPVKGPGGDETNWQRTAAHDGGPQ